VSAAEVIGPDHGFVMAPPTRPKPRLVFCERRHLAEINYTQMSETDTASVLAMIDALPYGKEILHHNARSIEVEGRGIAALGVWPQWPGVGRAWTMLSPEALLYPKTLHGWAKATLAAIMERDRLHRVEAVVRSGHTAGHRWVRRLGFRREGELVAYGMDRSNFHLYARIEQWPEPD
jgi:hypothetical protein